MSTKIKTLKYDTVTTYAAYIWS